MVYQQPNQEDEGKSSEYNSAQLKMKRMDEILQELNDIDKNLKAFNIDYGIFNYELKFILLDKLYQEIKSTLTKDETSEIVVARGVIEKFINKYPIYKIIRRQIGKKTEPVFDEINLKQISILLFDYESLIRTNQDKHGLDNKYSSDDSGL